MTETRSSDREPGLPARARQFAINAHRRIDQSRKYTGQPYDVHLKAVAEIVATVTDDEESIAAAWLHDVVEDTPATIQEVELNFGSNVAELVNELTDVSKPSEGNRAARKAIDRAHLADASPRAMTIKLADLIDNAVDICRHDPRFGKVFLHEMGALLEVLTSGDERLLARASKTHARLSKELQKVDPTAAQSEDESLPALSNSYSEQRHAMRLFIDAFHAKDIAEPLRSFDGDQPAEAVGEVLRAADQRVAGIREGGVVTHYVRIDDLTSGSCGQRARSFSKGQLLPSEASLSDVVHVLTRYDYCFVAMLGVADGFITRQEMQRPIARMWLFGMITMIEASLTQEVRRTWAARSWHEHLPPARLRKAEELLAERQRRGQKVDLIDCLQLADKAHILVHSAEQSAAYGFSSRSAAKQVIGELESLRNNLAHSQDIVTSDWAQIARMTRNMEHRIRISPGRIF